MSSSSEITWWHFSDLHWQIGTFAERSQFFKELFKDLKNRLIDHGNPDLIVLSGDIAYSGEYHQFEEAKKHFLDTLVEICGNDEIPIFVVAGNHDISRKHSRHINPNMITSIKSLQALNDLLDDEHGRRKSKFAINGSTLQESILHGRRATIEKQMEKLMMREICSWASGNLTHLSRGARLPHYQY